MNSNGLPVQPYTRMDPAYMGAASAVSAADIKPEYVTRRIRLLTYGTAGRQAAVISATWQAPIVRKDRKMILSKKELGKQLDKWNERARKAYINYQSSGDGRQYGVQRRAENMVDLLTMAYESADGHKALLAVRNWQSQLENLKYKTDEAQKKIIDLILSEIRNFCTED